MTKDILFVCIENAGRSQMAEAFFRKFTEGKFNVISAGTTPSAKVNPIVEQVMKEIGIDISSQLPKTISNSMIDNPKSEISVSPIANGLFSKNHPY